MGEQAEKPQPRRPATWEELCAVPDHLVAQIIDGELIVSPRPAFPHAHTTSWIGGALVPTFGRQPGGGGDPPGGWWVLDEPQLYLDGHDLVPDLAGWRRERVPLLPHIVRYAVVPDWVCEVLSPSTAGIDRVRKMRIYARAGVRHLWHVDPIGRTLEVYRLEDERWVVAGTYEGEEIVRAEPFDVLPLELALWWLPEAPAPDEPPPAPPTEPGPTEPCDS
jgi:Uma2 family endonuclease